MSSACSVHQKITDRHGADVRSLRELMGGWKKRLVKSNDGELLQQRKLKFGDEKTKLVLYRASSAHSQTTLLTRTDRAKSVSVYMLQDYRNHMTTGLSENKAQQRYVLLVLRSC